MPQYEPSTTLHINKRSAERIAKRANKSHEKYPEVAKKARVVKVVRYKVKYY